MTSLSLTTFLAGIAAGLFVAVPIGPMGVLCIQRTLTFGLAAGLATGLGAATVHLIFGSLAAVGLSATITAWFSVGAQGLSLLSAGLLFWFAIKMSRRTVVMGSPLQRREGWLRSYASALAFGLSNPVTVVLLAACLPSLTISDDPKAIPALISGVFLGSVAWWILLSTTVSLVRHRLSARALTLTNKASGLALAGLGVLMLASAFGLKLN
jgi:threonine/homoserine/homoserine lactone efflux protein